MSCLMSRAARAAALLSVVPLSSVGAAETPIELARHDGPVTVLHEVHVHGDTVDSLTAPDVDAAREAINGTPGGVDLVASEAYEDRYALTLKDALRDTPGVYAQARFGEEVRLSIRGSGLGRFNHLRGVLLLADGIPVSRADGFGDFQDLDPLAVRYLEVYKGGNGLAHGSASLGGAINLVTPTGRTAAQTGLLRLDGGSYDTWRAHAAYAKASGALDVYSAITVNRADGFRDQSRIDNQRFSANVGYRFSDAVETRFYVNFNEIDQEIPGTVSLESALTTPRAAAATALSFDTRRDPSTLRLANKTSVRLGHGQLDIGAYGWVRALFHPVTGIVVDQRGAQYGGFFQWNGETTLAGLRNEITVGGNATAGDQYARVFQNVGGARGALLNDAIERAATFDLYGENRLWIVPDVALITGLQAVLTTRDFTDQRNPAESASRTYKAVNPKLGALWQRDAHTQLFGNVSYSYEAPDFGALNQNTPLGANGFVPLDAQRAVTFEIGTRGEWTRLAWNLGFFHAQVEDELLLEATSPTTAIQFNASDTTHRGVEAALAIRLLSDAISPGDRLTLQQTYTWSDFRFDGDTTYGRGRLAGAPQHYVQAQLRYRHPVGVFIEPGLEAAGSNGVDYANTQSAPGYVIWNLSTGVDLPHGLSLFLDGRNLLDRRYASSVTTTTNFQTAANRNLFYPAEGRQFFGGVRWAFD